MISLVYHVLAWPTFFLALLVFGFAPGAALRLIVLAYKREDPRRHELISELYHVPRIERPFWVAEQLETALSEGLGGRLATWSAKRLAARRAKRPIRFLAPVAQPGRGRVLTLLWSPPVELRRADVQPNDVLVAFQQAVSTGDAKPVNFVRCSNHGPQRAVNWALLFLQLRDQLTVGAWQYADPECPQQIAEDEPSICLSFTPAAKHSTLGSSELCAVCGSNCQ